jgi:hypothetical protein
MYKLISNKIVLNKETGFYIPFDPDNTDYQAYLAWVSEGNVAEPAEENQ